MGASLLIPGLAGDFLLMHRILGAPNRATPWCPGFPTLRVPLEPEGGDPPPDAEQIRVGKTAEKTFTSRIERGFDFLGYHLRPGRLAVAQKTVERFIERTSRLYERKPGENFRVSPAW